MVDELWTSIDALEATRGTVTLPWSASGVSIDSRTVKPGDLFIALEGEAFDGHDFVEKALKAGAAAAIVSHVPDGIIMRDTPMLVVPDTFKALNNLGRFSRARSNAEIIAVTGSVGKTSVKEALSRVLSQQGKTFATEGNFNNHIGLPLMLCRMAPDCKFAVFELGMNHAGEISHLTHILQPDMAIITTIEPVHMEQLGSLEAIADAKSEIFEGVEPGGAAIIPADNPYYERLNAAVTRHGIERGLSFGEKEFSGMRLVQWTEFADSQSIVAGLGKHAISYTLPITGKHHAINSLAVLSAVYLCGADITKATETLQTIKQPEGRGKVYQLRLEKAGKHIDVFMIDDSYNASPTSMRVAIGVLAKARNKAGTRAIALLGDMLELGINEVGYHKEVAANLLLENINGVCTSGRLMGELYDTLPPEMQMHKTDDPMTLLPHLMEELEHGDIVLIKGSHGSNMWKLAEALRDYTVSDKKG